jgi:hypothetical protein
VSRVRRRTGGCDENVVGRAGAAGLEVTGGRHQGEGAAFDPGAGVADISAKVPDATVAFGPGGVDAVFARAGTWLRRRPLPPNSLPLCRGLCHDPLPHETGHVRWRLGTLVDGQWSGRDRFDRQQRDPSLAGAALPRPRRDVDPAFPASGHGMINRAGSTSPSRLPLVRSASTQQRAPDHLCQDGP